MQRLVASAAEIPARDGAPKRTAGDGIDGLEVGAERGRGWKCDNKQRRVERAEVRRGDDERKRHVFDAVWSRRGDVSRSSSGRHSANDLVAECRRSRT